MCLFLEGLFSLFSMYEYLLLLEFKSFGEYINIDFGEFGVCLLLFVFFLLVLVVLFFLFLFVSSLVLLLGLGILGISSDSW